jgi:hypothetical protein
VFLAENNYLFNTNTNYDIPSLDFSHHLSCYIYHTLKKTEFLKNEVPKYIEICSKKVKTMPGVTAAVASNSACVSNA